MRGADEGEYSEAAVLYCGNTIISKGYVVPQVQIEWEENEPQMFWHVIMEKCHTCILENETYLDRS